MSGPHIRNDWLPKMCIYAIAVCVAQLCRVCWKVLVQFSYMIAVCPAVPAAAVPCCLLAVSGGQLQVGAVVLRLVFFRVAIGEHAPLFAETAFAATADL